MKMQVIAKEDIPAYIKRKKGAYEEVYKTIDAIKPGHALVIQFEDAKKAKMFASAISAHIIYDRKHDGRSKNWYYTQSCENVIVGKN